MEKQLLPVLFVGHGSPMNAIETNPFTQALERLGKELPRPKSILCVSAHWYLPGLWVTRMEKPKTIHDFSGFPKALDEIEYPAPGSVELADRLCQLIPEVRPDETEWGLDHGSWAVLRFLYPQADVPVVQLSFDLNQPASYHYALGQKLRPLRSEGVLVMASGNLVHNLRQINWERDAEPFPWAVEFDAWVKEKLEKKDHPALVDDYSKTEAGRLSVPRPDHYYPFLYTLGASEAAEAVRYPYEGIQNASISMRTITFGS